METWTEVRRKVLVEGVSKRQIKKEFHVSAATLDKILSNPEPPGYRQRVARPKPKLGDYLGVIDQILEGDRTAPPKQRHTAKRIYVRLRDEYGYDGCESQVRAMVASSKRFGREVFVPLSQPLREAQFDFGEATVEIAGDRVKAAFGVMTLPYSDAFLLSAFPRECTETFQQSHVRGFEHFGAVPTKIAYDNTSIAVSKVMGRERNLTHEFLRLESYYLFAHRFCRVARGNEKGHVENLVGYGRRSFMVPVPSFNSFGELNDHLTASCTRDLERSVRGKREGKLERLAEDVATMHELPETSFEARRIEQRRANSLSLVRSDRNDYSVPTAYAHHELTVLGGTEDVRISCAGEHVATHPRHWGDEHVTYNPCTTWRSWSESPEPSTRRDRSNSGRCRTVWAFCGGASNLSSATKGEESSSRCCASWSTPPSTNWPGRLPRPSTWAVRVDAISLILAKRAERPVALFVLDGHPHLKQFVIDPPDLGAYRTLTSEGAQA